MQMILSSLLDASIVCWLALRIKSVHFIYSRWLNCTKIGHSTKLSDGQNVEIRIYTIHENHGKSLHPQTLKSKFCPFDIWYANLEIDFQIYSIGIDIFSTELDNFQCCISFAYTVMTVHILYRCIIQSNSELDSLSFTCFLYWVFYVAPFLMAIHTASRVAREVLNSILWNFGTLEIVLFHVCSIFYCLFIN